MLNIGGVVNIIGDILSVYAMTSNNGQNIVLGCHCLRIFFRNSSLRFPAVYSVAKSYNGTDDYVNVNLADLNSLVSPRSE